jgi:hypothetical protein
MVSRVAPVLLSGVLAAFVLRTADAQRTNTARRREAGSAAACSGCRIVVKEIATLNDERCDVDFEAVRVMRLPSGQFLVGGRSGVLGLFDAELRFLRQIGRGGAGPGAFRQPMMVLARGDSVGICGWALRRLTVCGPELRVPARTVPLPEYRDAEWLDEGRLLLTGLLTTARQAGSPLHLVSSTGSRERSFGTETPTVHRNSERELGKSMVRSPAGKAILVANTHRYEVEAWTGDLQGSRTFREDVPWFSEVPASSQRDVPSRTAPRTELGALPADRERGVLWASSYSRTSSGRERRTEMMRIRSSRSLITADQCLPSSNPITSHRSASSVRAGISSNRASSQSACACSRSMPCFAKLLALSCASNSNSIEG